MFQFHAKRQAICRRAFPRRLRPSLTTLPGLAVAALVAQVVCTATIRAESSDQPNVVIILVDDMGYGDLGCYNTQSKITTPAIDSLARDGMRFTDAHAAGPLCHMSRYGLMTGRYPFRTDVSRWPRHALIEPGQATVASVMKSAGYHTAMVGKWHLGFEENGYDQPLPGGPVDVGFDQFFGIRASTDIPPYFYIRDDRAVDPPTAHIEANRSPGWSPIQGKFWRAGGIAPHLELDDVLPRFTQEAESILDQHAENASGKPLMLYVALPAPHTPWLPSPEYQGSSGAGLYGDFLMMVDSMVGRLLAKLDQTGMADETLVIFSSDNGPVWYDRDTERFGHDSVGGLRGMKGDAWEAGHRMPFLVRWPGKVQAGSVSDQLISFTDVMATLATIAGVSLPEDAGPDSFDFSPVLLDPSAGSSAATSSQGASSSQGTRSALALRSANKTMTIRQGPWKLITALGSGGFSKPRRIQPEPNGPTGQLYDLSRDKGETTNLYSTHPEIVARLTETLQSTVEQQRSRPLP